MRIRASLALSVSFLLFASPALAQEGSTGGAVAPGPEQAKRVHAAIERVLPSVVKVYGASGFTGIPSYGVGTLVHERGFILTSWSIALRTPSLRVVTHDGRRFPAEIWRADPGLGVALLKIKSADTQFQALRLADSSKLKPGDSVVAIGNPFGIVYGDELPSVMQGVVSGLASPRRGGFRIVRLPVRLETVILTDVPNNPGTQGGPLLDAEGQFIGVLGRLIESRATNTILNFAIPSSDLVQFVKAGTESRSASPVAVDLPERKLRAPLFDLGIRLQRAHLVRSPVAYVERVASGSPAAAAGLEGNDLIFRLGTRTIRTCRDFDDAVLELKHGTKVALVVKRGERMLNLTLETPKEKGE